VVFTLNLLLRSRDSDSKEIKEMTFWEAHFGRKPNLNRYLIGPWGCLAYIMLTKEQQDKRGMDKKRLKKTEGVVRAYDAKRAVFDILYEDNDEEEVDFLELGDILIMGKEFGDKDEHKGMKRAEVTAQLGKEALIAAMAEEAMASHGRTSYGEERPERHVTFEGNLHPCAHVGTMTSSSIPACDCGTCLNGGTGAGAPSGERLWRSRPDIKKDQEFDKWKYAESDRKRCECTPGGAGDKELGFVHNAVKCECDTCRYCYTCQTDEVKWSEDKLRAYMDEDSSIKLGEGDFRYTKAELQKMLRKRKIERESVRVFTAAVTGATGGEAQRIEDSVSPPASKEMETKIDDAPRNSKELHAHEE